MSISNYVGLLGFVLTGINGANKAKEAGKANQALNNYNAQISDMKARDAIERGSEAVAIHRLKTKQIIGSQRAAFAASGVDISDVDSTAHNVFDDTLALSEQDAIAIQTNAAREAWGYRQEGKDFRLRGTIARAEGDDKFKATLLGTAGTALYSKYGFRSS